MPGSSREHQERLPDFYLPSVVRGQRIHAEVRAAFEQLWPWFWTYVGRQLGDSDRAADLVEEIAFRVSRYIEDHDGEVRSLVGLCRVAAVNLITSLKGRESRIDYLGLSQEVEAIGPPAEDGRGEVELSIWADQILEGHNRDVRTMLELRLLRYSWPEIGRVLGLGGDQARLRFRRAMEEETDADVLPRRRKKGRS